MTGHPFVDSASGVECIVHVGPDDYGIEHGVCPYRAEVFPNMDAFFCSHCEWNGRISGAWFLSLLPEVTS